MKEVLKSIASWVVAIAVCYLLSELGILKYIGYGFAVLAYLAIGCLISGFAGDEPKPWLESHPVLLYAFHISIALFWIPLAVLLLVWVCILFVLESFGISLEKKEKKKERIPFDYDEKELIKEIKKNRNRK